MLPSKQEKIQHFNPNGKADMQESNLYGLPFNEDESEVVIVPVPWEVTVSYSAGTASGPESIMDASAQVDLYDADVPDAWKTGIFMQPVSKDWRNKNAKYREIAVEYINSLDESSSQPPAELNSVCKELKDWVYAQTKSLLEKDKLVGIVGGEHSVPLGFMQALADKFGEYGILQIDAHADLRNSYEGFELSHASIMFNSLKIKNISKLIQVGIRDICQEEIDVIQHSENRVETFFDKDLKEELYTGKTWQQQCQRIINRLPEKVYVSFDIDGLDPKLCPHTGTPVAGGIEMEQAFYLLRKLVEAGKQIIGFDLCEVAPGGGEDEWDANVGARVLYKLCNLMAKSNGRTDF